MTPMNPNRKASLAVSIVLTALFATTAFAQAGRPSQAPQKTIQPKTATPKPKPAYTQPVTVEDKLKYLMELVEYLSEENDGLTSGLEKTKSDLAKTAADLMTIKNQLAATKSELAATRSDLQAKLSKQQQVMDFQASQMKSQFAYVNKQIDDSWAIIKTLKGSLSDFHDEYLNHTHESLWFGALAGVSEKYKKVMFVTVNNVQELKNPLSGPEPIKKQ